MTPFRAVSYRGIMPKAHEMKRAQEINHVIKSITKPVIPRLVVLVNSCWNKSKMAARAHTSARMPPMKSMISAMGITTEKMVRLAETMVITATIFNMPNALSLRLLTLTNTFRNRTTMEKKVI